MKPAQLVALAIAIADALDRADLLNHQRTDDPAGEAIDVVHGVLVRVAKQKKKKKKKKKKGNTS
jgi:hypothetical protein